MDFVKWMLGLGQAMTSTLDFAPLPAPVVAKELQVLSSIH